MDDNEIFNLIETMDYDCSLEEFREEFWEYESEYSDGNIDYSYYGG